MYARLMAEYEAHSLNLSMRWAAKPTSVWAGETWQTHLRLLVNSIDPLPLTAGRVEPEGFAVVDSNVQRTNDIWSIAAGWAGGFPIGNATITDDDINAILATVKTWLIAINGWFGGEYVFEGVRLYPMLKGGGSPFRAGVSATAPIIATPTTGAVNPPAGNAMQPDAAIALSLGTGTRGPSGRGRMFLGGLTNLTLNSNGLVKANTITDLGTATEALLEGFRAIQESGITPARFTPVIYSARPNKVGANADTASVINRVRISDEFDTQRRRDRQRTDVFTEFGLE